MDSPASAMNRSPSPVADPRSTYAERIARFDEAAALADTSVRNYGRLRLATFAAAVAGPWLAFAAGRNVAAWGVVAVAAATFGFLVKGQRRARRRRRLAELTADANRRGISRLDRRWDDLPPPADDLPRPGDDLPPPGDDLPPRGDDLPPRGDDLPPPGEKARPEETPGGGHDCADDLDVHGRASLLRLLHVGGTPEGRATLRGWLLSGADRRSAVLRQQAVTEMAAAFDFRDRLAAEAALAMERREKRSGSAQAPRPDGGTGRFLRWAEGDGRMRGRRRLLLAAVVLPPVNVTALALYLLGVVPSPVVAWPVLLSLVILGACRKRMNRAFSEASDGESGVRDYGPVLAHLSNRGSSLESRCFADVLKRLGGEGQRPDRALVPLDRDDASSRPAHREIERLRRLLDMADARHAPLFHLPLALFLFWDVHVLAALERWKARSGHHVRGWLEAMAEAEALAALAALAADHPDWTMPTLDDRAATVRGRALGHPLLPPEACVRNDVEVGPPGSFLLVTGSNMSGKSTLLKAIGLNVVLARAGAPVCARSLRLPSLRVATSMSVRDSLADGVSHFMAELQRLKRVVDACEHAGPRTLYLLDEVLQGTNSAERQAAARTVLRRLLASGAVGAATTHDLALADSEDLAARAVAVHFTETVTDAGEGGGKLVFDYRLRPGIATSTNALRLLGLVGLE